MNALKYTFDKENNNQHILQVTILVSESFDFLYYLLLTK